MLMLNSISSALIPGAAWPLLCENTTISMAGIKQIKEGLVVKCSVWIRSLYQLTEDSRIYPCVTCTPQLNFFLLHTTYFPAAWSFQPPMSSMTGFLIGA